LPVYALAPVGVSPGCRPLLIAALNNTMPAFAARCQLQGYVTHHPCPGTLRACSDSVALWTAQPSPTRNSAPRDATVAARVPLPAGLVVLGPCAAGGHL